MSMESFLVSFLMAGFICPAQHFWDLAMFCLARVNSFLLLSGFALNRCTIICISICLLMDNWFVSNFWQSQVVTIPLWTLVYTSLWGLMFSCLLFKGLGPEFLGYMIRMCLAVCKKLPEFCIMVMPFCIPSCNVWEFSCSHLCQYTLLHLMLG